MVCDRPRKRGRSADIDMSETYTPKPVNPDVELPQSLEPLVERLSAHVHDSWAAERIRRGWKFGPERNDARKEHPSLVPYEQLSESEKDLDRATVREALRGAIALGFRISKE